MAANNAYTAETYSKKLIELGITDIFLIGDYIQSRLPARHHCNICGADFDINPDNLMRRKSCPVCSGRKVVAGINDIATVNPELARHLADSEDAHRYTIGSSQKVRWKCADCGAEKEAVITSMARHFSCPQCGDGISYPEKFIHSVLTQSGIDFIRQLSSAKQPWCQNYRYDFYFEKGNKKIIVEANGAQHYKMNRDFFWDDNSKILENDKQKETLAKKNGITEYIKVDCSVSKMDYIKDAILRSGLAQYISDDIDWVKCGKNASKSFVPVIAKMYNDGSSASAIAKELDVAVCMVRRSLKHAEDIGLCKYDELKKWNNPQCCAVVHLDTKRVYATIAEASKDVGIHPESISNCCKGRRLFALNQNKEPTHWVFYRDYDSSKDYSDILACVKTVSKHNRPVICLTTGDIFDTAAEAGRWAGVKSISDALKKNYQHYGRHPVTGERLQWAYWEV